MAQLRNLGFGFRLVRAGRLIPVGQGPALLAIAVLARGQIAPVRRLGFATPVRCLGSAGGLVGRFSVMRCELGQCGRFLAHDRRAPALRPSSHAPLGRKHARAQLLGEVKRRLPFGDQTEGDARKCTILGEFVIVKRYFRTGSYLNQF